MAASPVARFSVSSVEKSLSRLPVGVHLTCRGLAFPRALTRLRTTGTEPFWMDEPSGRQAQQTLKEDALRAGCLEAAAKDAAALALLEAAMDAGTSDLDVDEGAPVGRESAAWQRSGRGHALVNIEANAGAHIGPNLQSVFLFLADDRKPRTPPRPAGFLVLCHQDESFQEICWRFLSAGMFSYITHNSPYGRGLN